MLHYLQRQYYVWFSFTQYDEVLPFRPVIYNQVIIIDDIRVDLFEGWFNDYEGIHYV